MISYPPISTVMMFVPPLPPALLSFLSPCCYSNWERTRVAREGGVDSVIKILLAVTTLFHASFFPVPHVGRMRDASAGCSRRPAQVEIRLISSSNTRLV